MTWDLQFSSGKLITDDRQLMGFYRDNLTESTIPLDLGLFMHARFCFVESLHNFCLTSKSS